MQGLFIVDLETERDRRPKSKKEIKDAVKANELDRISVEATSFFGNEYEGELTGAPAGTITAVGPDPHTKRNFYLTLEVKVAEDGTRSVKVT
jgi:hypothetical protein